MNLIDCVSEENMGSISSIAIKAELTGKNSLYGVGIHLIKKLSRETFTSRKHENNPGTCPCQCGLKDLGYGDV